MDHIHSIQDFLSVAIEVLKSPLALRIYACLGGIGVLISSFLVARAQREDVKNLADFTRFTGPLPKKVASIQRQLSIINSFQRKRTLLLLWKTTLVVVCGFLIPSLVVIGFLHNYAWFLPGDPPLARQIDCATTPEPDPSFSETTIFVLSQFSMGVASLANEIASPGNQVAGANRAVLTPNTTIINRGLVGYRYFVGGFVADFVFVLRAFLQALTARTGEYLAERKKQLDAALNSALVRA